MRNEVTKKICTKCKVEKDVNDFGKKDANKDGLQSYCKACTKAYKKANPGKCSTNTANYRASKLQRTVPYAKSDLIQAFYTEAQRLTNKTGIQHHVDHVIPLQHKDVSGLHVHNNLQVITATENCSKGNKFIPGRQPIIIKENN